LPSLFALFSSSALVFFFPCHSLPSHYEVSLLIRFSLGRLSLVLLFFFPDLFFFERSADFFIVRVCLPPSQIFLLRPLAPCELPCFANSPSTPHRTVSSQGTVWPLFPPFLLEGPFSQARQARSRWVFFFSPLMLLQAGFLMHWFSPVVLLHSDLNRFSTRLLLPHRRDERLSRTGPVLSNCR